FRSTLRERVRQRRRTLESKGVLDGDGKESVVHYDNAAFADHEETLLSPVSPLSERPSPRLPPIPVPRRNIPSDASTGPPTPSSSVSLKPTSASKQRIRHRLLHQRRHAEQRRSITVEDPQPTALPRATRKQVDINEDVVQDALQRRREALSKWKTSASLALRQSEEAAQRTQAEESADFFTKKWSSVEAQQPEPNLAAVHTEPPSTRSTTEAVDDKDATSLDADEPSAKDEEGDDLLSSDHYVQEEKLMCKMVKPTYVPPGERKLNESLIYHMPSARRVPLETKELGRIESGELGAELNVQPSRNLPFSRFGANQMENRLVTQNELYWFDRSGNVSFVGNFLNELPSRLPSYDDIENIFQVRYSKASVYNPYTCDAERYMELEIDVSTLKFHHHPLFSREHVLASNLSALYDSYALLVLSIEGSNDKEKASPWAMPYIKILHEELERMDYDAEMHVITTFKKKLMQLVDARQARDRKEKGLGEILEKMCRVWEEIESLRRSQGYTATDVTLKHGSGDATASAATPKDLEDELSEELEVRKMVRRVELMEYDRKWRRPHPTKASHGHTSLDSANSNETFEMKPLPPPELDEANIAEQVRRKLERKKKNAGTKENTAAYLTHSSRLTPANQCPREEQRRKRDVSNTTVHLRIVFNDKEVCKTEARALSQDFTVTWGEIFTLHVLQFPESLTLEVVHETRGIMSQKLADVPLPVPDEEQTIEKTHLTAIHFASDMVVSSTQAGVGCGLRLEVGQSSPQWLSLNGDLVCSAAWIENTDGRRIVVPSGKSRRRGIVVKGNGGKSRSISILDRTKLRVIAQGGAGDSRSSIDVPKDLGNLKEERIEFCDEAELERNPRFRLLRLRDSGSAEFRNFGAVPLLPNEYSVSLIEKIYAKEPHDEMLPSHRDPIEDRQVKRAHLMKQMREEVIRKVYESQTHRVLEDVIIEEKIPIIGSLGFGLFKLAKRHRPLRPSRKERRKVTGQSVAAADAEILVTVLRATNVPVRKDGEFTKGVPEEVVECQVRPFVEVMFQRKTARTFVAEGPHPTWNQELRLPLSMDGSDGPCSVKDIIYLNLFDEVVLDLLEDDRERSSTVYQRLERRWLGNLKVPFSTLYLNSKIEGTFRLDTPPVLLGYVHEVKPWSLVHDAPSVCTYISFYLTIEPGLQPPEVLRACCESTEASQLVQNAEQWQSALHSQHPQRFVKALAMDASGKWVFVPRFLRPLAPPEELLVSATRRTSSIMEGAPPKDAMGLVARFVSLIPTLSDSVFFPGLCDIWSTCDQFLQVLVGDEEEHAILLCNFFLHLGKEAYLLLGTGIPEGQTAYVLTREERGEQVGIWNAVTGKRYSATDSYGPLQNVGCLVGRDNIWANIQKHQHPSRLSYNLSKANHWKPFFPKGKHQTELESVQPSELVYEATDPAYVEQLQQKIEYVLKESIMNWRKRFRTSWNRYASQVLRKILPRKVCFLFSAILLESMAASLSSTDDIQELSEILTTYKMSGFPLSMSFTDVDTVVENVLSTSVHLTEAKNAEFALAVHIHPYPSNVLAVWVYVAVLSRKS
ncbi:unnamed protein product, partial [Ixodes hexagonus]